MAFPTTVDIDGGDLLAWIGRAQIGSYTEQRIDAEIALREEASVLALAIEDFKRWAAACDVDLDALTGSQEKYAEGALKWYVAAKYKELDMGEKPSDECGEMDYKTVAEFFSQACVLLGLISTCMQSGAGFCSKADSDYFRTRVYSRCGADEEKWTNEWP